MQNGRMKKIVSWVIIIILLFFAYKFYQKNNFNDYTKAEYKAGISKFERDSENKYSKYNSYKITNTDYNDAMFFKKINVNPNTSYKITCMIKTQDVQTKNENTDAGAHICINGTTEKSDNVIGTTDWTKVEFLFNSKNETQMEIGFRLGGFEDNAIGTVWFSDFKIEATTLNETNEWNFLCILFDNIDVNIENNGNIQNIKLSLTENDKYDMKVCLQRFKNSMQEMTNNKIKVEYDILESQTPITNMSYDEENGYFVSGYDVKNVIDEYIKQGKYDHIFIAFRTGDINKKNGNTNDWIGLGYMEYRGIGFSNIRLPEDENDYIYKYDSRINTFPEEVYIHEFLHTLERNSEEYGYTIPQLHDNEKYGYQNERLIRLKRWYQDYMNCNIKTSNGNIGLSSEIYTKKPVKISDFEYSYALDEFKEPENIIEELNNVVNRIISLFSRSKEISYNNEI